MAKTQATKDGWELANVCVAESGYDIHNGYAFLDGAAVICDRCGGFVEASVCDEDDARDPYFSTLCEGCLSQ